MDSDGLKKARLRATLPRLKILQLFKESSQSQEGRHMRAEDVYSRLRDLGEDVSLATVYRVLRQFESSGLLVKHRFKSGQSHYELKKGNHHDHYHLICRKCGKVLEFFNEVIEGQQKIIAKQYNFEMTDYNLIIYGVCTSCRY